MTVAALGYAIAVGRSASGTVLVGLAVLGGQLCIGWQNDATDAPRDLAVGRKDKPIATGAVARRTVGGAALLAGFVTVPLSLASGWRAGAVHLTAVGSAAAYNGRLKSGPASFAPYVVSFGLLPAFVTLGARGSPLPPWWVVAGTASLGCSAHFLNVAPDREGDLATGVRSLPHRLGHRPTAFIAAILGLASSALLAFGSGHATPVKVAGFSVTAGLALFGTFAAARGSRSGFRAIVLVALVDVALLLVSAR